MHINESKNISRLTGRGRKKPEQTLLGSRRSFAHMVSSAWESEALTSAQSWDKGSPVPHPSILKHNSLLPSLQLRGHVGLIE